MNNFDLVSNYDNNILTSLVSFVSIVYSLLLPFIVIILIIGYFIRFFGFSINFLGNYAINKKLNKLEEKTGYKKFKEMKETFDKTNRLLQISKEIKSLTNEIYILKK